MSSGSGITQTFERSEYQQVKADLHRKILDRLNLERLGRTPSDAARDEVLALIRNSVNSEAVPLSFAERERGLARISSSVAGGAKLKSVLMFLHMVSPAYQVAAMASTSSFQRGSSS